MRVEMSFARIDSSFVITLKSTSDLAIHEDQKIQFFLRNKKVIDFSSGGTHNGETKYSLEGKLVMSAKILGSDLVKKIRLWHASGKMDFELDFWQSATFQETIKCMTHDL